MKAWPSIGLLLLIGCTLDTSPNHTESKPAADEFPDWRPNTLDTSVKDDASAAKTAAVSRAAGSSAAHVDAAPAKTDTSQPAEPVHTDAGSTSPAAGSGAMDDPPPPTAAAASDAAMPSAPADAGVPVTMTMTMVAPPASPSPPEMNGGAADPPGQSGEHGKGQGEDRGNHGKREGERVDGGSPMTERPPAEGMHTAETATTPQSANVVTSILDFVVGVVDGSVATQLVVDLLVLAGSPDDTVVAAVLTEGLHALDDSNACRGGKSSQCAGTCELLASDCSVCAGDASCLDALSSTCGKDSVRACQ